MSPDIRELDDNDLTALYTHNHGAHYQFHEDSVAQVKRFLDAPASYRRFCQNGVFAQRRSIA
ncbi:MAG TPA: hypothetical protein VN224_12710 [Xanthomonadales bacterium]|nr:hypothetical protein [Xanthomonadales bacterium]